MTTTSWDTRQVDRDLAALSETTEQRPAATGSALAAARRRRNSAIALKYLDLDVPDMEGPDGETYFVRYRAIEHAELTRTQKRHEKSKADNKALVINATVLALCCVGVGRQLPDGTKLSADPDDGDNQDGWPRFDDRLAALLEVNANGSFDVMKELYDKDGLILSTGARLTEWSGYALDGIQESVSGG